MPECWKWENGGRIPPFSFVKMNDMGNVRNDRDSAGADIRAGGHAVKTGIRKRDRPDLYRILMPTEKILPSFYGSFGIIKPTITQYAEINALSA